MLNFARKREKDGGRETGTPQMAGWVTKRGGRIKTWKRRYMVLTPIGLVYFKNPEDQHNGAETQGSVEFAEMMRVGGNVCNAVPTVMTGKPNSFAVHTAERTYYISAGSPDERGKWIRALKDGYDVWLDRKNNPARANTTQTQQPSEKAPLSPSEARVMGLMAEVLADGAASVPWMRSKLMVTGQGRAGKTSTINSLLGKPFNPLEVSTDGVDPLGTFGLHHTGRVFDWTLQEPGKDFKLVLARRVVLNMSRSQKKGATVSTHKSETNAKARKSSSSLLVGLPYLLLAPLGIALGLQHLSSKAKELTTKAAAKSAVADTEEIARYYDSKLIDIESETGQRLSLSIWDYGGQHVFRAMQNYVLTSSGTYLVVFDMSTVHSENSIFEDTLEDIRFWLNTIRLYAPEAAVLLVGAKKDLVGSVDERRFLNGILEDTFAISQNKQIRMNLTENLFFFPVDNTAGIKGDSTIQNLRNAIIDSVKDQEHVMREVPLTWVKACDALVELFINDDQSYVPYSTASSILVNSGVRSQDVPSVLSYFHQLGVFVYVESTPDFARLGSMVILNPQWSLDAFSTIIRDRRPELHGPSLLEQSESFQRDYRDELRQLKNHAVVSKRLLFALWGNLEPNGESEVRSFLLDLMKSLFLLCKWKNLEDLANHRKIEEVFLVPSLLELDPNMATYSLSEPEQAHMLDAEATFEFDFSAFFLPSDLFSRLVSVAVEYAFSMDAKLIRKEGGRIHVAGSILSRPPYLTNKLALMSFGEAEFSMQMVLKTSRIVVGVRRVAHAAFVLSRLDEMLSTLKAERANSALKYQVILIVNKPDKSQLKVDWSVAKANLELPQPLSKVACLGGHGILVDAVELECFLREPVIAVPSLHIASLQRPNITPQLSLIQQVKQPQADLVLDEDVINYDLFLSHYQITGGDQCEILRLRLEARGVTAWVDKQSRTPVTEAIMGRRLSQSHVYLLFLSKDVLTRDFVQMELRRALAENKPILMVHEVDATRPSYAPFQTYIDGYKAMQAKYVECAARNIFNEVESIDYERRSYKADGMIEEIIRRLSSLYRSAS